MRIAYLFLIFFTACTSSKIVSNNSLNELPVNEVVSNSSESAEDAESENVVISGNVKMEDDRFDIPKTIEVKLIKDSAVVSVFRSANGVSKFFFQGRFPKGEYELVASSEGFQGSARLEISTYLVEEIIIILSPQ